MDADVKRKISRAKLPPPLIKPKFQPLIRFCQGLSIRYAITFGSEPPTQGCIFRLTCSHPELTEDHVLTSAYVRIFRNVTRNAVNKCWKEKRLFLTSLKQTCNEYLIKFSENQSSPEFENRKTSPYSPCAPNLLHVLVSWILG